MKIIVVMLSLQQLHGWSNSRSLYCKQAVVDAVLAIRKPNEPIDLYMVEIMEMRHKTDSDTVWVHPSVRFLRSYRLPTLGKYFL